MVAGIGSSIWSAIAANRAAREQRKKEGIIANQNAEKTALIDKELYKDAFASADMQNALRILDENQQKQASRDNAQAAIMGASPEQMLAAQDSRNKSYADAIADLASTASLRKDQWTNQKLNQIDNFTNQRLGMQDMLSGIEANKSNQLAQGAVNAFQSGTKMLANGIDDVTAGKSPLAGTGTQAPESGVSQKDWAETTSTVGKYANF